MDWYLMVTQSGAERAACEELAVIEADSPIECFFPRVAILVRPHRCRRARVVLKAAFQSYVFVNGSLDQICPRIERARHAYRLVRINHIPLTVSATVIDDLRHREVEWVKHPMRGGNKLSVGQPVVIVSGAFIDVPAIIVDIRGKMAELALAMKGKLSYKATVPLSHLRAQSLDKSGIHP